MYACEKRSVIADVFWQGGVMRSECRSRVVQVCLVEDRVLVVSRYGFPVSVAQGVALFGEASQVGYGAYLLGADTLRGFVNSLGFFCRLRACVSEAHVWSTSAMSSFLFTIGKRLSCCAVPANLS